MQTYRTCRNSSSRHDLCSLGRYPLNAIHYTLWCLVAAWSNGKARLAARGPATDTYLAAMALARRITINDREETIVGRGLT